MRQKNAVALAGLEPQEDFWQLFRGKLENLSTS